MSDHTDTPDEPLDAMLTTLFAATRPDPALEDRLVRSLRSADAMPKRKTGWRSHPLTWGVAASIGLGGVGALVSSQLGGDGIPLPWETGGRKVASVLLDASESRFGFDNDHKTPVTSPPAHQFRFNVGTENGVALEAPNGHVSSSDVTRFKSLAESTRGFRDEDGVRAKGRDVQYGEAAAAGTPPTGEGGLPAGVVSPDDGETRAKLLSYYAHTGSNGRPTVAAFNPNTYRWDDRTGEADKSDKNKKSPEVWFARPGEPKDGKDGQEVVNKREAEGLVVRGTGRYSGAPGFKFNTTATQPADPGKPPAEVQPANRKVILRSGEVEFEVESFDPAVAAVTKLVVAIDGAFVSTVNSEKLPNGKVKGAVTVRVPPDKLDGLVLDLRRDLGKGGELKGQRIGSQDVTKQYTDLESRLKAARTMETRLLAIIKDGKGEIKQLLDAEKELGVWRTKIEEYEGELRYFANLAALSTLTITLAEKEIKAAAGVTESEVVQTGVEVEDVEQAFRDALAAVAAANGRVSKSDLKQVSSGQFNATLNFETAPDAAGPVRDRLRQLGRVARLEISRSVVSEGGTVTKDAKVKRGDTQFQVQLYNVANVPPRETAALTVATLDVPAGFRAVREAVEKAKGRVLAAALNETDKTNVTAQLDFEVKRADEAAVLAALGAAGEVVGRQVTRAAEADTVTDTKVLVRAQFQNAHRLPPRELIGLTVEVDDVDAAGAVLTTAVQQAGGRETDSGTSTDRGTGKVTARYVFDVPLVVAEVIAERAKAAGAVRVNQVSRNPSAPEGRFATARLEVLLTTPDRIVAPDDGFVPQVKKGLSHSVTALFASLTWLVFGLLVVLPWAVVLYGGYRLVRRLFRSPAR